MIAVGGGGLVLAGRSERVIMLLATVVALAFPVLFFAWVYRYSGFGLQARYVLPMLTLIPLVGGELIFRARDRLPPMAASWLPGVALTVIAGFQLFAWWINARDSAGQTGGIWFLGHPRWSPPLGWWPWTASAVIGAVLLFAFAVYEARSRSSLTRHDASRRPVAA